MFSKRVRITGEHSFFCGTEAGGLSEEKIQMKLQVCVQDFALSKIMNVQVCYWTQA